MIMAAAALAVVGQVELRGHDVAPTGVVVGVEAQGVLIAQGAGMPPSHLIGWDRVKEVNGVHGAEAVQFEATAEAAWRARTRLERGDAVAAEPMFEMLFETYVGQAGPTSLVVSEGLLRCRLRRGAHVGAMEPWMALLDARQSSDPTGPVWMHEAWSSEAGLAPVLDESGLVPSLPPMWLSWPSVSGLATSSGVGATSPRAAGLSALYLHAAKFEVGEASTLAPVEDQHWSIQLVRDIVTARTGDASARRQARLRLRSLLEQQDIEPWVEAWCRAGVGRSLVLESSREDRMRGVLELLHLPARFRRSQAYLSGLVLGECIVVLANEGDDDSAAVLARELTQGYLGHPVLDWPPLASYLIEHDLAAGPAPSVRLARSEQETP